MGGPARSPAGFTLIEMLVVLAVLALVVGLVVSRGPVRSQRLETDAAARSIFDALRLARSRAIAQDRPVGVTFDVATNSFRLDGTAARALPASVTMAVTAVAGEMVGGHIGAIRFAPDGSSTGGRVELADGGRRVQVGVDWLTGRASIADAH